METGAERTSQGALGLFSGLNAFPRSCIGGNMRKRGFFIGFLSEAEKERDNQVVEVRQLLKEYEKRSNRLAYILCVASIIGGAVLGNNLGAIQNVALHLLGH